MKLALVICTVLAVSLFADGSVFERGEHVICTDGQIRLAGVPRKVVDEDFKGSSRFWESFDNYENKLLLDYSSSLKIMLQEGRGGDTAFGLRSRPVSVTPGSSFTMLVTVCGSIDMSRSKGHLERYNTEVLWLAKDGSIIEKLPFNLNSASEEPVVNRIVGTVPQKTASMVLCIGADSPNFNINSVLDIRKITIETVDDKCRLWPVGSMVSRPFPAPTEGTLSWDADIPRGGSIAVQISTAADADGIPGKWSPFCGPDWDADKAFMKSGVQLPPFKPGQTWMRYRILFKADKKSPVVKGIRLGAVSDGNWAGADSEAPTIVQTVPMVTQDANKPFQFKVLDNTVIDWATLELKLDGRNVTANAKRDGHVVTFVPPDGGFAPSVSDFDNIEHWTRDNYRNSLRIEVLQDNGTFFRATRDGGKADTMFTFTSPKLSVRPGVEYTFSIDVRHNLQLPSSGPEKDAVARLTWIDAKGNQTGKTETLFVPSTEGWKNVSITAKSDISAATAVVSVGFDNPNIYDGHFFDCRSPKWSGDAGVPQRNEPNGNKFTVKVSDFSGNTAVKELFLLIDKPLVRNNVTLRDDGCVLIDGKPFFPIGLYGVCKREFNGNDIYKAFEELALNGFNTAHTYAITRNNDYAEFLDAAAKYNVKLFVCASIGTNSRNIVKILNDVVREYRHPQHLSWYLGDDTSGWIKPHEIAEIGRIVKGIDPAHITVQADGVFGAGGRSQYTDYVNSTDGFLPEIYPLRKGTPPEEIVPTVIRDMLMTKADIATKATSPKTVWPIIQYFDGWGWPRFPTYQELRAMSYAAIVHGANGITWYTYGGFNNNHGVTSTPERWKNICRLATEINRLQSALVSRESFGVKCRLDSGPSRDSMNYPSISLLAKKAGASRILICVNSTLDTIEAEFKLDEDVDVAKVLFEERTVPVRKQTFTDTFAPYDVHVYELKGLFE